MFTSLELLTTSFVAVGLAADAVAVSLTSGLMIRHIHVNKALKIALFFGGFQAIMPIIGWGIGLTCRDFQYLVMIKRRSSHLAGGCWRWSCGRS